MIVTKRTGPDNKDFHILVQELDKELTMLDKEAHSVCAQFNKIESINHVIVAYIEHEPVGCGAIREYTQDTMEIKRMFVSLDMIHKGVASLILNELENWTKELGYKKAILETGERLPGATKLYEKHKYVKIPNYGQYKDIERSICYEKDLVKS